MRICFAILFAALAVLSCINYSYDGVEKIEADKQSINIKKPPNITNDEFLRSIDAALADIGADIMYRYVDVSGEKMQYIYFKTSNTDSFISVGGPYGNIPLSSRECLSTTRHEGYDVYNLRVSSMFQDITFYNWGNASVYDLSSCIYYIAAGSGSVAAEAVSGLGYEVAFRPEAFISGKMSVALFAFVPICLMLMSMVFYALSNGKKNVLRKMEGYLSVDILWDELRSNGKSFLLIFIAIESLKTCFAVSAFKEAASRYILFAFQYTLIGAAAFAIGAIAAAALIFRQSGSEQIKGKAPQKGMYYITMLVKCVFMLFIVFFMSIAIRNVQIAHNTYEASQFIAEKVSGYVTVPVFGNNASYNGLEDNYLAFYKATVDEYGGVLIDSSNYELSVSSGATLCELLGQEEIVVNRNYLRLNPIYSPKGDAIALGAPPEGQIYVLIPETKMGRVDDYREFILMAYSKEANFIAYDGVYTEVYSYNANTGGGSYGRLDQPVIIVAEADDLEGVFVLSYCSKGGYFIKPRTGKPYAELFPLLKETGIDAVALQAPYILSNFDEAVGRQFQMLLLYGTQTLILSIGLACLILFSAKLYCENYRKKIACCMVEGYSLLACMRPHIVVTAIAYLLSIAAVSVAGGIMQVSMNNYILAGAFILEAASAFAVSKKYTKENLSEIVKGAE
jgi:hypothetical protein